MNIHVSHYSNTHRTTIILKCLKCSRLYFEIEYTNFNILHAYVFAKYVFNRENHLSTT